MDLSNNFTEMVYTKHEQTRNQTILFPEEHSKPANISQYNKKNQKEDKVNTNKKSQGIEIHLAFHGTYSL